MRLNQKWFHYKTGLVDQSPNAFLPQTNRHRTCLWLLRKGLGSIVWDRPVCRRCGHSCYGKQTRLPPNNAGLRTPEVSLVLPPEVFLASTGKSKPNFSLRLVTSEHTFKGAKGVKLNNSWIIKFSKFQLALFINRSFFLCFFGIQIKRNVDPNLLCRSALIGLSFSSTLQ